MSCPTSYWLRDFHINSKIVHYVLTPDMLRGEKTDLDSFAAIFPTMCSFAFIAHHSLSFLSNSFHNFKD